MRLSINKIVKNNLYYFFVIFIVFHLYYTNLTIYFIYIEEKLYWERLKTTEYVAEYEIKFSFEDYNRYGTTVFSNFIPYFKKISLGEFFFYFFSLLYFILYVLIPLVFRKKINLKISLIIDTFAILLSILVFLKPLLDASKSGVIPLYIFIPLVFSVLLAFRIYQYRKKLIYQN